MTTLMIMKGRNLDDTQQSGIGPLDLFFQSCTLVHLSTNNYHGLNYYLTQQTISFPNLINISTVYIIYNKQNKRFTWFLQYTFVFLAYEHYIFILKSTQSYYLLKILHIMLGTEYHLVIGSMNTYNCMVCSFSNSY